MRFSLLLSALVFIIVSCKSAKNDSEDDLQRVKYKFDQKLRAAVKAFGEDTLEFQTQEAILYKMRFLFKQTIRGDAAALTTYQEKLDGVAERIKDTMELIFFKEVLDIGKAHPALFSMRITLQDSSNKHVLAYTSKDDNEELLTILNIDEDNRAFVADFDFPNIELLLCNYDVYLTPPPLKSLALRPFEARIYKIH